MEEEWPSLSPVCPITNYSAAIESVAVKTHSSIKSSTYSSESWLSFIRPMRRECHTQYDQRHHEINGNEILYKWIREGNFIQVVFTADPESVKADLTGITSSAISGLWWDDIHDLEVTSMGEIVQVQFSTDYEWPIPILGGEEDALSGFYLALVAEELGNTEAFEFFMQRSAMKGDMSATRAYGLSLVTVKRIIEAEHWLARVVLLSEDQISGFCLASLLIGDDGIEPDFPLAENILVHLVNQHFQYAYSKLALLYLNGAKNLKKSKTRAKMLLDFAVKQFDDEDSKEMLQNNDFSADETKEEPKESEKEVEENREEGKNPLDYVIAGGILMAAAGAAYLAYRRFRK